MVIIACGLAPVPRATQIYKYAFGLWIKQSKRCFISFVDKTLSLSFCGSFIDILLRGLAIFSNSLNSLIPKLIIALNVAW